MSIMTRADSIATAETGGANRNTQQDMLSDVGPRRSGQRPTESVIAVNIADRISHLLFSHKPALFCDDCIADKLGMSHRRQVNRVTAVFGTRATFWRAVGACSECGKHKQVIRHV